MFTTRKSNPRSVRRLSKAVRSAAKQAGTPYPIEFVDGFAEPQLVGKSYYFTNKSGCLIRHPSAYRTKFGKPIYHSSTHAIEVGIGWLIENGLV